MAAVSIPGIATVTPTSADTVVGVQGGAVKRFGASPTFDQLSASSGAGIVGYDGDTVQTVLDDAKPMQSYTALRAYTGRATGVRITTAGLSGFFSRSLTDTTSADNGGTIIVDGSGRRWLRLYSGGEINVKWFGAKGDGITDDSAALLAALAAAKISGQAVFVPPGTYRTTQLTLYSGQRLIGANWNGSDPNYLGGAGRPSVLKALDDTVPAVIYIPPASTSYQRMIEVGCLGIEGSHGPLSTLGTTHGIYSDEVTTSDGSSHIHLHDVAISGVGGKGVYLHGEWHTLLERVDTSYIGDNHFDLGGGNTTILIRTYAHNVKAGKCGYRIHEGQATLIACNGIDASEAGADWGVFGDNMADDGRIGYFRGTLIGCNVEAFIRTGLHYKAGSIVNVDSTQFFNTHPDTVAILHDGALGDGRLGSTCTFINSGAGSWANGYAIHINDVNDVRPFISEGRGPTTCYNDATGVARALPNMRVSTAGGALMIPALAINPVGAESASAAILGQYSHTQAWTPGTIADGAVATTSVTTIPFAALGDTCTVSFSLALAAGLMLTAHITANNTAQVTLLNKTGGPVTLGAGTLRVAVWKYQ